MILTNDIQPIVKRKAIVGWLVRLESGETVQVDLAELPAAGFPTIHQIRHVAACKVAGLPGDKVAFAMAMDAAFELALRAWDESEEIRRHCVRRARLDWKACRRFQVEDWFCDADLVAQVCAYELPQLNWNPSECNTEALIAIISAKPLPKPKRSDPAIRQAAIDALASRERLANKKTETIPF